LKADIVSGGLTMGGGLLAGALIGALGAAGVARGINVVRGTGQSWVAWSEEALNGATQAALLRYLAVAHFGRGRGDWAQGEAPAHWQATVAQALAARQADFSAAWQSRSQRPGSVEASRGAGSVANRDTSGDASAAPVADLTAALQPLLAAVMREVFTRLYGDSGFVPAASAPRQE
jgi:hypothetical protein